MTGENAGQAQTYPTNHTNAGMRAFEIGAENAVRRGECLIVFMETTYIGNDYYHEGLWIQSLSDGTYNYNDVVLQIL